VHLNAGRSRDVSGPQASAKQIVWRCAGSWKVLVLGTPDDRCSEVVLRERRAVLWGKVVVRPRQEHRVSGLRHDTTVDVWNSPADCNILDDRDREVPVGSDGGLRARQQVPLFRIAEGRARRRNRGREHLDVSALATSRVKRSRRICVAQASFSPRWTPQNRPCMDGSKPAIWLRSRRGFFSDSDWPPAGVRWSRAWCASSSGRT